MNTPSLQFGLLAMLVAVAAPVSARGAVADQITRTIPAMVETFGLTVSARSPTSTVKGRVTAAQTTPPISCTSGVAAGTPGQVCVGDASGAVALSWENVSNAKLSSWSGCASVAPDLSTCTVNVSTAKTVTANFVQAAWTLTARSVLNGGSGTLATLLPDATVIPLPAGAFTCAAGATCQVSESAGSSVTIAATPALGSKLVSWAGCSSQTIAPDGASGTCTVAMTASRTVTATFGVASYAVSVSVVGGGTVSGTGVSCPGDCQGSVTGLGHLQLSAIPSSGYAFASWSGCPSATGAICSIPGDRNYSITAVFESLTCQSCHGTPPPAPHIASLECGTCHPGYTAKTVDNAQHLNGSIEATCTACHGSNSGTGNRSSHVDLNSPGPVCSACHEQSYHATGVISHPTEAACIDCHGGRQGQTLSEKSPPLLVGWEDAAAGDFHGAREGTCRFDILDAVGQRSIGQGGFPCPTGQPQSPNALRITSRWWYVTPYSGPWSWTCDIEPIDAAGNPIGPKMLRQPCPTGTFLNSQCNNPTGDAECYPVNVVTRGFGGTLAAPFVRGQGALPCAACHDSHSSSNSFLFAAQVNGVSIPPGSIDRAGVGAQVLCNACHMGDRHEVCKACHKERWETDGEYSWHAGAVVDPVPDGAACFYCHGHEGILHMRDTSPAYPGGGHPFGIAGQDKGQQECSHCHENWFPPPTEYTAPALGYYSPATPKVAGITATTAVVSWNTTEPATSYVEYGVGSAGFVAGTGAFVRNHSVTLAGLDPSTTYVWRVRTTDVFHNVTKTALQTFTTPSATGVPVPDLEQVQVGAEAGTYSAVTSLMWYPVVAPSGTTVEYEVELASDPDFTYLENGSMFWEQAPTSTDRNSGWVPGIPATLGGRPTLIYPATITNIPQDYCGDIVPNIYYWRVRARDQQGNVSEWSVPATFGAFAGDPLC